MRKCCDKLKFALENLSLFSFLLNDPLLEIREFPGPGGRSVTTQWGKPKGIWPIGWEHKHICNSNRDQWKDMGNESILYVYIYINYIYIYISIC